MEDFIRSLPWEQVYLFLGSQKGLHTGDEEQVRRFFEGVCLVLRSGMQWRFLLSSGDAQLASAERFFL